jgi:cytoskeletal protein RodZ
MDKETIANARTTPWEPGATAGKPKVLIGLVGAVMVGAVALAIVLYPTHVAKTPATDPAVATQAAPATGSPPADKAAAQAPDATAPTPPADTTVQSATNAQDATVPSPIVTPPSTTEGNTGNAPASTSPKPSPTE